MTIHSYASGEITADVAAERIGATGCSTLAGIYVGAAAGLVVGPGGAVIATVAGYTIAAHVYQSGLAILRRARLADEEASRVEALCEDATEAMRALRHELDNSISCLRDERQRAIDECLTIIDAGWDEDSHSVVLEGLTRLTIACCHTPQLVSFGEFDQFMLGSEPLRI